MQDAKLGSMGWGGSDQLRIWTFGLGQMCQLMPREGVREMWLGLIGDGTNGTQTHKIKSKLARGELGGTSSLLLGLLLLVLLLRRREKNGEGLLECNEFVLEELHWGDFGRGFTQMEKNLA